MNCERIEKLLPLYVEDDMSAQEMEQARAHLSSCDACARLEAEFRSSQKMLHSFEVPEFGAEFYEQIRGSVLAEINSRPLQARPTLLRMLRSNFIARPAFAASLALLVLCGALSLIFYRSVVKSDDALISLERSMGDFNLGALPPDAGKQRGTETTGDSSVQSPEQGYAAINISKRKRMQREEAMPQREGSAPQSIDESGAAIEAPQQVESATTRATVNAASTQAIARMEIQTSDPNIRIIWLGREKQADSEK